MTHGIDDWYPIEKEIDFTPEVAQHVLSALEEIGKYTLDTMTLVVKANGPALHDFVYSLPGRDNLLGAKPKTWQYIKTTNWKVGDVVSLLCLCSISNGFKSLQPIAVLEIGNRSEIAQSRKWNSLLVNKGPEELLRRLL